MLLVEETNMVEAIPQAYVVYYYLEVPFQLFIQSLLRTVFLDCSLSATIVTQMSAQRLHESRGFRSNHRLVVTGPKS